MNKIDFQPIHITWINFDVGMILIKKPVKISMSSN